MIFACYLLRRYVSYVVGIALFFAGLSNLVEFFEKLIRVSGASVTDIAHFVFLHFGPSFIEYMPLASWLAVVLIIREYHQRHEWDTLSLLMITKRTLCLLFFFSGCFVALGAFFLNECLVVPISSKAERFRSETFKKLTHGTINNKSMWLPNNIFCSIDLLDVQKNEGDGLVLVCLSPSFTLEKVYTIDRFKLDAEQNQLHFYNGFVFSSLDKRTTEINNFSLKMPSFLASLRMHYEVPRIWTLTKTLMLHRHVLAYAAYFDTLQQLIKRLLFYLQIMVYPLLTIFLFYLAEPFGSWKWLALLVPYGLLTGFEALILYLIKLL